MSLNVCIRIAKSRFPSTVPRVATVPEFILVTLANKHLPQKNVFFPRLVYKSHRKKFLRRKVYFNVV